VVGGTIKRNLITIKTKQYEKAKQRQGIEGTGV